MTAVLTELKPLWQFTCKPVDREEYLTNISFANGHVCPFCGGTDVAKNGKRPDGNLKDFMHKFRGVSSKYLNNYLVWNNFVNQVGETYTEKRVIMLRYCLAYPQEIQGTTVRNRVPLPVVA